MLLRGHVYVVLDVQEIGDQRTDRLLQRVMRAHRLEYDPCEKHVIRRPYFQSAADNKAFHVERTVLFEFAQQQSADQKSGKHEEQVYSCPSEAFEEIGQRTKEPGFGDLDERRAMAAEHQQDRDAAQKIELNDAYRTFNGNGRRGRNFSGRDGSDGYVLLIQALQGLESIRIPDFELWRRSAP